jgi:hypothetical protein
VEHDTRRRHTFSSRHAKPIATCMPGLRRKRCPL